jgi:hypothetical protein
MRNIDDVSKGLAGFVNLWDTMANEDLSGKFQRRNEPLSYYWRAVKSVLPLPLLVQDSLQSGFWPSSTFGPALEDQFHDNGTMREEYAEDARFMGRRRNRPPPSFRVGHDVYARYFLAVCPADGDLRLFWVARAVTNPNPDPAHANALQ